MDNINNVISIGIPTTVIGILIVFSVLILLSFIVNLFKYIAPKPQLQTTTPQIIEELDINNQQQPNQPENNEEELIAVITAAIAASINTSADKLIVRSFRKVSSWNIVKNNE